MNVEGQYNPKDVECIPVENLEVLPSGADWQSRHLESERRKAEIRDRIGKSYNDYIADHQMNMFEDFIGYQGSAVLDEPVREEDSFSKESMSQESEISENILLPDLAKQSESIEQQSGEIAERGMPT